MVQVNYKRLTETEETAIDAAAERLVEHLMEQSQDIAMNVAYARVVAEYDMDDGDEVPTDETVNAVSDIQVDVYRRILAKALLSLTAI